MRFPIYLTLSLALYFFTGCSIPSDPDNTLKKVRNNKIRVGISENKPWTIVENNGISGVEVWLIKQVAKDLNADISWQKGTEYELMQALKHKQLDLVISGLVKKSPWKKDAGFSRPFMEVKMLVGVPQDQPVPDEIDGMKIGVRKNSAAVKLVEEKDGIVVPLETPEGIYSGAVAGYEWELKQWNKKPADIELLTEKHVFAVQKGENAWLVYLEKFADKHKDQLQELLQNTKIND